MAAQPDIEGELRQLDLAIKTEELARLRSARRLQWITPTAIGVIVPMIGGLSLWIFNELKTFNEGYRALDEIAAVRAEKDALAAQKDSLNIEISALVLQKRDYLDEARRAAALAEQRQALIDATYLRAKFALGEATYALDHTLEATPEVDWAGVRAVAAQIAAENPELGATVRDLAGELELARAMMVVADEELASLNANLDQISPSSAAQAMRWAPRGAVVPDRSVLVSDDAGSPRYYDVAAGRYLTPDEITDDCVICDQP